MQVGIVGLGKMGLNMLRRLRRGGHEVVAYDINAETRAAAAAEGAKIVDSLMGFKTALAKNRAVWVMVPAGQITEATIKTLSNNLEAGDIIVDGGNSNYKDSIRRAQELSAHGIGFLDSGTSGGVWGLENGYCLMIGGTKEAFDRAEPIFKTLAPEDGYLHTGPSGSGHFVKMIHNGIEYALMQSYAEGFDILNSKTDFNLDLQKIAALWNRGSVVRSWLLELLDNAFQKSAKLSDIRGYVEDSGEGRWTVISAIEESIPAPTIAASLFQRFRSRKEESFGDKIIAALRNEFGGHAMQLKK